MGLCLLRQFCNAELKLPVVFLSPPSPSEAVPSFQQMEEMAVYSWGLGAGLEDSGVAFNVFSQFLCPIFDVYDGALRSLLPAFP